MSVENPITNPNSIMNRLYVIHDPVNTEGAIDPNMNFGRAHFGHLQEVMANLPPDMFDDVRIEIGEIKERGKNHGNLIRQIVKQYNNQNPEVPIIKTDNGFN